MSSSKMRIKVSIPQETEENKLVWLFVNMVTEKTIDDLCMKIRERFKLQHKFQLFLEDCLLINSETIELVRDNDIIEVKYCPKVDQNKPNGLYDNLESESLPLEMKIKEEKAENVERVKRKKKKISKDFSLDDVERHIHLLSDKEKNINREKQKETHKMKSNDEEITDMEEKVTKKRRKDSKRLSSDESFSRSGCNDVHSESSEPRVESSNEVVLDVVVEQVSDSSGIKHPDKLNINGVKISECESDQKKRRHRKRKKNKQTNETQSLEIDEHVKMKPYCVDVKKEVIGSVKFIFPAKSAQRHHIRFSDSEADKINDEPSEKQQIIPELCFTPSNSHQHELKHTPSSSQWDKQSTQISTPQQEVQPKQISSTERKVTTPGSKIGNTNVNNLGHRKLYGLSVGGFLDRIDNNDSSMDKFSANDFHTKRDAGKMNGAVVQRTTIHGSNQIGVAKPNRCNNNINEAFKQYEQFSALKGSPRIGDVIAFQQLEISSDYTPEVSPYREGRVITFNSQTDDIAIELSKPLVLTKVSGKFDVIEDEDDESVHKEIIEKVETKFGNLLNTKLLQ